MRNKGSDPQGFLERPLDLGTAITHSNGLILVPLHFLLTKGRWGRQYKSQSLSRGRASSGDGHRQAMGLPTHFREGSNSGENTVFGFLNKLFKILE